MILSTRRNNLRGEGHRRSSAPEIESSRIEDANGNITELLSQKMIEENVVREKKLKVIYANFLKSDEFVTTVDKYKTDPKTYSFWSVDELWKYSQEISALYNINLNIMQYSHSDSAARFEPIKDRKVLQLLLVCIIPEICKLPYSFYKKAGIRILSFCMYSHLNNSSHEGLYNKKRLNGLFSLDSENNPEKILKHFYKILCYHIIANEKNFEVTWKKLNVIGFKYGPVKSKILDAADGFLSKEAMKSPFNDQAEILAALMMNYGWVITHSDDIIRSKAMTIRDIMNNLDREGMTDDFWLGLDDKSRICPFKIFGD